MQITDMIRTTISDLTNQSHYHYTFSAHKNKLKIIKHYQSLVFHSLDRLNGYSDFSLIYILSDRIPNNLSKI